MENRHSFEKLIEIMAVLRGPGGCPWDRKQTHESILQCLIEEAHEYIDAVYRKNSEDMLEELGDILLQVVFHSRMAEDRENFSIHDVIHGLCEKLLRRHPHVFGDEMAANASEVVTVWERVKKSEKPGSAVLGSIPPSLPPLLKAEKIQKKVKKVGFEWPDIQGPLDKLREELQEMEEAIKENSEGRLQETAIEEEFGDLLFSMVNLSRHLNINASAALEKTNLKFMRRFEKLEQFAFKDGRKLEDLNLGEMENYWEKAKNSLNLSNLNDSKDGFEGV